MKKRGRKQRDGIVRRVQIRLESESVAELFDRYSDVERNEIFNKALKSVFPAAGNHTSPPVLVRPPKTISDVVARIRIVDRRIDVLFPEKLDSFRSVVKGMNYAWANTCWTRTFAQSIDVVDRAAELCNELLLAGFCCQVTNDRVVDRVVGHTFQKEPFRIIKRSTAEPYLDWFTFVYPKGEDWYPEIMKLTAAKYSDGRIFVPPEIFAEVEDFAQINEFNFSDAALDLLNKAKSIDAAALIIQPKRRKKQVVNQDAANEIPEHLRDDPDD